jgi:hypothetical protein
MTPACLLHTRCEHPTATLPLVLQLVVERCAAGPAALFRGSLPCQYLHGFTGGAVLLLVLQACPEVTFCWACCLVSGQPALPICAWVYWWCCFATCAAGLSLSDMLLGPLPWFGAACLAIMCMGSLVVAFCRLSCRPVLK